MKSKAPLALIEQLVMLAVFALAAALCVQAFVLAWSLSRNSRMREQAAVAVQNAAETLKAQSGDYTAAAKELGGVWNGSVWEISYDGDWCVTEQAAQRVWYVQAVPLGEPRQALGTAEVRAFTAAEGTELFVVTAAWQEVEKHG